MDVGLGRSALCVRAQARLRRARQCTCEREAPVLEPFCDPAMLGNALGLHTVDWCRATYRSYDPGSGYYRAWSGRLVFCG